MPGENSTRGPAEVWPALPLGAWKETRDTLHMYTQVVGKVRLACAPMEPEWGQVPLYVTVRGLTTSPIPFGDRTFAIDFDFIGHQLRINDSEGAQRAIPLVARPVKEFYRLVMETLAELGIKVAITTTPSEVTNPIRFPEDDRHASYDPEWAHRFWRVLAQAHVVFKQFRAPYRGRTTPVQFFWGTFDLALTRYSGRPAEPPPGSDPIRRRAMDAEEVAFGFWPGDDAYPEPAFYSYTYPKPPGLEEAPLQPAGASWSAEMGEFLLPYEAVRQAEAPRAALLAFLESTYAVGANGLRWDRAALEAPLR
jgi:Family of unknown function (DUF5996)